MILTGVLAACGGTGSAAPSAPASAVASSAAAASGAPVARGQNPGGPRASGGARGNGAFAAAFNAAAQTLNMQPNDLQQQLRSGKTLQQVAQAQNVDVSKVETAMTNAAKPDLDQAVQNGSMTSQQEQNALNRLSSGQLAGNFARGSAPSSPPAA